MALVGVVSVADVVFTVVELLSLVWPSRLSSDMIIRSFFSVVCEHMNSSKFIIIYVHY